MFEIQSKYKLNTHNGRFYTGTIISEDEHFILLIDKFGDELGIAKTDIKDFKKIEVKKYV
jgi:hypothetical protein